MGARGFGSVEKRGRVKAEEIIEQLREIAAGKEPRDLRATQAAELIRDACGYSWVGFYDVGEGEIAAMAWTGSESPAFPSFPITMGAHGDAVRTGAVVNVPDVSRDPRYLTAVGSARSEIIVPVRTTPEGLVAGTIDVESEKMAAFGPEDEELLRACAEVLIPLWI
jgi:GAF domain-containing protein